MADHYVDTSVFSGSKQFSTPRDGEIRVEYRGLSKSAVFYRERSGAFVRVGYVSLRAPAQRMTPKQLHAALRRAEDEREDEAHEAEEREGRAAYERWLTSAR